MNEEIRLNEDFVDLEVNTNEETQVEVEESLRELIVTNVPVEIFTDEEIRLEFEQLFQIYAPDTKLYYFKALRRCYIKFSNSEAALNARYDLDGQVFDNESLRVFFAQPIRLKNRSTSLKPPENTKAFLISPPASPPVGWESGYEDPPVIQNSNLLDALSNLSSNEPCELIKSSESVPGIVIYPCEDPIVSDRVPMKITQTRRPH